MPSSVYKKTQPTLEHSISQTSYNIPSRATIGRDAGSDIIIHIKTPDVKTVSRNHAEILKQSGDYCIRDLGSTNGTYVNQEKVTDIPYKLKDGDHIRLGHFLMVYHAPSQKQL